MNELKRKSRVLIVEDEHDLLYSMNLILIKAGFEVSKASNGKEALDIFKIAFDKGEPFDLVVTDIQMPDLTGTELIVKIQEMEKETPILVITGYGSKDLVIELMRLGCLDYLDKPFQPSEFIEHINQVLEKYSAKLESREIHLKQLQKEKIDYERQLAYYRNSLEKYEKELKSAKGVYENLVQVKKDAIDFPVAWRLRQYAELGGDFLDVNKTPTGFDILVADVSGHDIGASYHTVLLKAFFEENKRTGLDGNTFFNLLNRQLLESKGSGRIITAIFVRINTEYLNGEVVSAGHPSLIRMRNSQETPFPFQLTGDVLGIHDDVHFETRQFDLKPGDRYFLFSDGIIDCCSIDGITGRKQKLTASGLEQLIKKNNLKSLEESLQLIWEDILAFCHYKPADDMILFAFEIPKKGETYV